MEDFVEKYPDGSVRSQGKMLNGRPDGYWEWYRLDGSLMRTGNFTAGRRTGEWVSYDVLGEPDVTEDFGQATVPQPPQQSQPPLPPSPPEPPQPPVPPQPPTDQGSVPPVYR